MITKEAVRLGNPVELAGRVMTPVIRVRYTVAGADPGVGGFASVEPLGVVLEETGGMFFYAFDPLTAWDWISVRLEA